MKYTITLKQMNHPYNYKIFDIDCSYGLEWLKRSTARRFGHLYYIKVT